MYLVFIFRITAWLVNALDFACHGRARGEYRWLQVPWCLSREKFECGWRILLKTARGSALALGDPTWGASLAGAGERRCGGTRRRRGQEQGRRRNRGNRAAAGAIEWRRGAALGTG